MQLKKRNKRVYNRANSIVFCHVCGNPLEVGKPYCKNCGKYIFEDFEEGIELLAEKWNAKVKKN